MSIPSYLIRYLSVFPTYVVDTPSHKNKIFSPFITFQRNLHVGTSKSICFIINYCPLHYFPVFYPNKSRIYFYFLQLFPLLFLIFFNKDSARECRVLTWYPVRNILAQLCFAPDDSQPLGALVPMHPSFLYPAG